VNVGDKLFNLQMKETKNGHTGDLVEHNVLFFRKVVHACYDVSFSLY